MRAALPCLAITLVLAAAETAHAGSSECGLIRDPDKRRACIAEAERRPGECSLIRDSDERRLCRIRAEKR
ncbi:hypothetical protein [Enterovirga sp. CN4-39]|uniref:hypothetical protein n=1 Tax=Enterovirga sp. CN4-39 TaxID=3400910 RepID=UPI003C11C3F4